MEVFGASGSQKCLQVFGVVLVFVLAACTGGEHVPAREGAGGPVTKPRARRSRGRASSRGQAAKHGSS